MNRLRYLYNDIGIYGGDGTALRPIVYFFFIESLFFFFFFIRSGSLKPPPPFFTHFHIYVYYYNISIGIPDYSAQKLYG